jgi:hypothetical protein
MNENSGFAMGVSLGAGVVCAAVVGAILGPKLLDQEELRIAGLVLNEVGRVVQIAVPIVVTATLTMYAVRTIFRFVRIFRHQDEEHRRRLELDKEG